MAMCSNCMWREQCMSEEVCEQYTPVDEDECVDQIIERGRFEFRKEWFTYIGQDDE